MAPCFLASEAGVEQKSGVTFLQAKNTRVQLATYTTTLEII